MKDTYVTITGFWHFYGVKPFTIGKVLKCVKEPSNPYDEDAIKVVIKKIGTVGYIANSLGFKASVITVPSISSVLAKPIQDLTSSQASNCSNIAASAS